MAHRAVSADASASTAADAATEWPYTVSKEALDKLVEAFRAEHPRVGFTRVVVGDCMGGEGDARTEFPSEMHGGLMDVQELLDVVDGVLRARATIPSVTVTPRPPA